MGCRAAAVASIRRLAMSGLLRVAAQVLVACADPGPVSGCVLARREFVVFRLDDSLLKMIWDQA